MTQTPIRLFFDTLASPVGDLLLAVDDEGVLRALDFEDHEERMRRLLRRRYGEVTLAPGPAPEAVTGPIRRYFAGDFGAGRDAELWRVRREARRAYGGASRGPGQRREPGGARRAVPPGDRRRRLPDRLRRRLGPQGLAAAA